ncbi:MAG: hypothetical protein R3208_07105 [Ketobacteraceae bacterium]|nr:hypothetical protein [Ketobacteraceae bacterium]
MPAAVALLLAACFTGTGEKDQLRNPIAGSGISLGLQVNLPLGATRANAAAAIYEDGVRQPLVGGDFFVASSINQGDYSILKSLQNLSGDYEGSLNVLDENDQVIIATEYDPERAREDRWYPVDQLLIDPGPNEDLVGYSETFSFPQPLQNLAINQNEFTSRADNITLTWEAGDGDQITSNAVVTCYSEGGKRYTYPIFNVLADDDGSYTLQVRDIIPNESIVNAVATLTHEVLTILSAAILEVVTYGLVDARDIPLSSFQLSYCDVDLTVFREVGFQLPMGVAGGFAIASTSDSVRFTYRPPVTP